MWRSIWTARPRRAQRRLRALGLVLLATAAVSPLQAQVTPPDPATRAAMDKRTAARSLLSSALARLAANANDNGALLDAGRASIDLEDYRAALGFLVRAEQGAPRDGAVKAALGSVMVHMENPTRALDYFGEAQLLGAPERQFLADRGLARDLLGQQDAAQRDYQLALSVGTDDEVTRRYALSLAITGDPDRAVQMLAPQLRAQDRAAWRLRALILAINGRNDEATEIVNATMPPALAQNILPYLTQMDRLNPAQQAAAAHFGRFPSGPLGPPRKPVQMAAAAPAPAKGRRGTAAKRPAAATAAPIPAPTPAPAPAPAAVAVRRAPAPTPSAAPPATPPSTRKPAPPPTPTPAPTRSASAPVADSHPATRSAAVTPTPIGVVVNSDAGPVGPGFSIAEKGRETPPPAAATPSAPSAPTAAAPLASLADIVSSIEIPPEEMARPDNAIGAETLAKLQADKRKAEAADQARREKEAAAAKAKAEADAQAKAEADRKKANPARSWVQIATGSDPKALAFDYNRFAKKDAALFKGKSGATAEWGRTRRLLVGPFKDRKAAQAWLDDYKKGGGDAFLFDSEAGETVDPVK